MAWHEVPTEGIYCVSVGGASIVTVPTLFPWPDTDTVTRPPLPISLDVTPAAKDEDLDVLSLELLEKLANAVRTRVATIPPPAPAAASVTEVPAISMTSVRSVLLAVWGAASRENLHDFATVFLVGWSAAAASPRGSDVFRRPGLHRHRGAVSLLPASP